MTAAFEDQRQKARASSKLIGSKRPRTAGQVSDTPSDPYYLNNSPNKRPPTEATSQDRLDLSITANRDDGLCPNHNGDRDRRAQSGRRHVRDRHARE
jgi:hypothetical protein